MSFHDKTPCLLAGAAGQAQDIRARRQAVCGEFSFVVAVGATEQEGIDDQYPPTVINACLYGLRGVAPVADGQQPIRRDGVKL